MVLRHLDTYLWTSRRRYFGLQVSKCPSQTVILFTAYPGHNSIINSTLIHPHFLHIVTAGIENDIRLHSPTPNSPCSKDMALTPTDVRQLGDDEDADRMVFLRALAGFHGVDVMDEDEDPERTTIMMFDQ